jgi:hypothetical protein
VITLVAVLRKQAPAKLNKIYLSPFEKEFQRAFTNFVHRFSNSGACFHPALPGITVSVITLVAVLRKQAPAKLNKIYLNPFEKEFQRV